MPEPLVRAGGAACPAELTWPHAQSALELVVRAAKDAGGRLDLRPLVRFDSSALAVFLEVRRQCGPATQLQNPAPPLRALAALYGVESLLFGGPQEGAVLS
jgi:ABC-type transporter Mla MlaB component